MTEELKDRVREFWDAASCGEVYAEGLAFEDQVEAQARARYELEPYIAGFARFAEGRGRDVLEVGVGMGADHVEWARSRPRRLAGVDLTPRAIEWTQRRLAVAGLTSELRTADAEHLPFDDESFDVVYSWGVLHHTPDTAAALREVHRVLRPGGTARVMVYHSRSIVGAILWTRYALLAGRPRTPMAEVYAAHLESPGTQAFTVAEARALTAGFANVRIETRLAFGDLLLGEVGQRHGGRSLALAKRLWPRPLIRRLLPRYGLLLLIEAEK
jgi:ubiquinone/menaquinone biosynthesis C-methylase UbiE